MYTRTPFSPKSEIFNFYEIAHIYLIVPFNWLSSHESYQFM